MADAIQTILVIEDHHDTSEIIAEELSERGFKVLVESNGRAGFSAILKYQPDLVICDINMPGMSGFDVLEKLIALAPRFSAMPFIFLTAQTDHEHRLKGLRLGADDFITKPVDFDVLSMTVTARLSRVARNNIWPAQANLSLREIEVLTWASRGKSSSEIAEIIGISRHTVDFHSNKAREKLGVSTRIQAVIKAANGRLIDPWGESAD